MSGPALTGESTLVHRRAIGARVGLLRDKEPNNAAYNHSVLCQTSLPYRNPGDDCRVWSREQGRASLQIEAGYGASQTGSAKLTPISLPYGPRARLVLIHIMTQAMRRQSAHVELDDSLTAFVRTLGLSTSGRNIKTLRDQLNRLAACSVRMSMVQDGVTEIVHTPIVKRLQVFAPIEPGQRSLWPSFVQLSDDFYESLVQHAVPLDPRALGALKHSASALDCYQWLAQRLCRVSSRGQFISWSALHDQLGGNIKQLRYWRREFTGQGSKGKGTLPQVLYVYPAASKVVESTSEGLILRYAPPPVPKFGRVQSGRYLR